VKYVFIAEQEEAFPVSEMCRVMDVSRSGYYDWCDRPPSHRTVEDEQLAKDIEREFKKGRRKYGSPKVWQALQQLGQRHSRKRIARLMAAQGLFARKKKRYVMTTQANPAHQPAPNLLNREFQADQPNRKWVSDITYIPTKEGDLYLATTMDLYSRRIIGWAMDEHMAASLTRRAFDMAIQKRHPQAGALHHSDRGSQYTDGGFRDDLGHQAMIQSMSRKGNCWDNAVMESFFAQLENELLVQGPFDTRSKGKQEVFDYIEVYYNRTRIHSTLGYLSPVDFEAKHWHGVTI
jgi:putative transposase